MIAADNKERTVGIFYYICICDTISKTCRYLIQQWWAGFKSDADLTLQSPIFFYFNVNNKIFYVSLTEAAEGLKIWVGWGVDGWMGDQCFCSFFCSYKIWEGDRPPLPCTQLDGTLFFRIFTYLRGRSHWNSRDYDSNVTISHFLKPETNKSDFRLYFELVGKSCRGCHQSEI